MNAIEIYADSARGIYIPQHFAESCADGWTWFNPDDRDILLYGPDHPLYWDTWEFVLDNAEFHEAPNHGYVWHLYQDGDLFAVCDELMTDEDYVNFYGGEREA